MDPNKHDEFLCRIAKTLYCGNTSSIDAVSLPLTELAAELYNEVKKESSLERLRVQEIAEIHENACVSTCSLVLAILYLERIRSNNPEYVEKVAPSELFLVSLLIASKFLNDDGDEDSITNYEWAVSSGMPLKTVNKIEKEFLDAINWEVYIAEKEFLSKLKEMERYLANQEAKRRGWYSYTEFHVLTNDYELIILKEILKYSAICVTCYATTVFSLIGTALLAIRVKYFLLHYILYILTKEIVLTNDQSCVTITTSSIDADTNATVNETTESAVKLRHEVPVNNSLLYALESKSNMFYRKSLFHSCDGWPNF